MDVSNQLAAIGAAAMRRTPRLQGLFYLVTGLWPLVDFDSFQAVTGPKVDLWLVQTVGLLLVVCGTALFMTGFRRRIPMEMAFVGVGVALALSVIEVGHVFAGTISPIYLLDTAVELLCVYGWFKGGQRFG